MIYSNRAGARSSLYERCTIANSITRVMYSNRHRRVTAGAKSSLYERCTIAILKHVYDVLKQGETAGAKSSLYERCTIANSSTCVMYSNRERQPEPNPHCLRDVL